jgi:hypothetical protein
MLKMMRQVIIVATISLLTLITQGCLKLPTPSFEMTHQAMLEKTIREVDIVKTVSQRIRSGARIALIPVANKDIDTRDFYQLEDIFTQKFAAAGYVIIQKPDHIALSAAGGTLETPNTVIVEGVIHDRGAEGEAEITQVNASDSVNIGATEWDHIKALLPKVDAFVVYNVHEYGLLLQSRPNIHKMINREFRIKMTIRLVRSDDLSILSVEDLNSFKSDDLHVSTLEALDEYRYNAHSFTYPLLAERGEKSKNWLSSPSYDWDFVVQGGITPTKPNELMEYKWFKFGIEANFGRLSIGLTPSQVTVHQVKNEDQKLDMKLSSDFVIQYLNKISTLGDKGRLMAGLGASWYTGSKVQFGPNEKDSALFGLNGILEADYRIYRSSAFQLMINGGVQLNFLLPQIEEVNDTEFSATETSYLNVFTGLTALF